MPLLMIIYYHNIESLSNYVILNALTTTLHKSIHTTLSIHRLWLGLLGYLIPFAPLGFASQCQRRPSKMLSMLVFFPIFMHFIISSKIPSPPTVL